MSVISVVIVNYNGDGYLQGAINSLKKQSFRKFEVIVIDNDSVDGSADNLDLDGLPAFRLLRQESNLGFAAGSNVGVNVATAPWIAMLNPDAEAQPDWLQKIMDGIERHSGTSMFSCAQYLLNDDSTLDGAGDNYLGIGIPWRGGFGLPASELPEEGECFSPCGASAVFNREVYLRHGGFDERFFCYCEDVDLGYRLRLAGERCIFLPDAIVSHAGSAISGRTSEFALFHGTRNRMWTYLKNTPTPLLIATMPAHVAMTLAILLRGATRGHAGPVWRGLKAGVAGSKWVFAARKVQAGTRKVSLSELTGAMVWNPMDLLGRRVAVTPLEQAESSPILDAIRS